MQMNGAVVEHAGLWLENALQSGEGDVLLTSPYLSFTECARVARAAQESTREIILCTVLDPFAAAQGYLSVEGLRRLAAAGVELRHVKRLHAKCFLVGIGDSWVPEISRALAWDMPLSRIVKSGWRWPPIRW